MARPPEMEFNLGVKEYAKERAGYRCAICGGLETPDDPLQVDHIIPIYFAQLYPFLSATVISHIANARPVHTSCHAQRNHYDEISIMEEVPKVIERYVEIERKRKRNRKHQ